MHTQRPPLRALLSVSDKTGLIELATALHSWGVELLATGGTASLLKSHHFPVTDVADYTGFPEMLGGRVKTLHPAIHAGILARRGVDEGTLAAHDLGLIDWVIVNLYPFAATIEKNPDDFDEAVEQIDIGGPTLLRAAAKNHAAVTAIIDPQDYPRVIEEMRAAPHRTSLTLRRELAQKVFAYTAAYDAQIAAYFARTTEKDVFPKHYTLTLEREQLLRYGENPHQQAAYYVPKAKTPGTLASATLLQGKPLSYNNMIDADCALQMVQENTEPYCVIVKHATPCGVAIAPTLSEAYQKAYHADAESAFGGIIALSQAPDVTLLKHILTQQFLEVLLVPDVDQAGLALLSEKPNIRVLRYEKAPNTVPPWSLRSISGGWLLQQSDHVTLNPKDLSVVTQQQPSDAQLSDLLFAWHVVKFAKSNAIVFAQNQTTLGIGAGQTSRVFSAKIAVLRAQLAGLSLAGAVMASDAFFPFADSIEFAKEQGIRAIIQPGGSKRDAEVIAAADRAGIAMVFTHVRHFRH